jgi:hypothetical protein
MKDNMGIMIVIMAVIALGGAKGQSGGTLPPEEKPPPTGGCSAKDEAEMHQWIYWLRNGLTSNFPDWFVAYGLGCDPCNHYEDLGSFARFYWNKEFSSCRGYNTW